MLLFDVKLLIFNEIRKYYIYTFVLHRGFFQQPRDASPPGEDAISLGEEEIPPGEDAIPQLGNKRRISIYSCYLRSQ